MIRAKRWLRQLSLVFEQHTRSWLFEREISRAVASHNHTLAREYISRARRLYGDDPELVRAETLISFLEGE